MRGLSPNWLLGTETLHLYIRRRLKSGVKNVDSGFNVLLPGSTEYEKSK
jgi:hypothetical protein